MFEPPPSPAMRTELRWSASNAAGGRWAARLLWKMSPGPIMGTPFSEQYPLGLHELVGDRDLSGELEDAARAFEADAAVLPERDGSDLGALELQVGARAALGRPVLLRDHLRADVVLD